MLPISGRRANSPQRKKAKRSQLAQETKRDIARRETILKSFPRDFAALHRLESSPVSKRLLSF
jgi:hypothetical protein